MTDAVIDAKRQIAELTQLVCDFQAELSEARKSREWVSVDDRLPELRRSYREPAPYVLACDAQGRMSVAYADTHASGHAWVMAKPIGPVTHWQPLPDPPTLHPADGEKP